MPWADRYGRFEDQLHACFALWTDEPPVEFSSPTVQFGPTWCEPRPVQRPIPIWFGVAATARNLALIRELGSGWMPIHTTTPEAIAAGVAALPAHFGVRAYVPVAIGQQWPGRRRGDAVGIATVRRARCHDGKCRPRSQPHRRAATSPASSQSVAARVRLARRRAAAGRDRGPRCLRDATARRAATCRPARGLRRSRRPRRP